MGRNVAVFKDFDDKIYKIINNKNAGVEYKPLTDALKPLIDHSNYISATKNMDFNLEFFLKVASDLRLC